MSGANQFEALFGLLLLAHLVGDFWLQPLPLVLWKQREWGGLFVHSGVHSVLILVVAGGTALQWAVPALLLLPYHALVDRAKVEFDRRVPGYSILSFFTDQAVHVASYAAVAWIAVRFGLGMSPPFGLFLIPQLAYINVFLCAVIAGTVVAWTVARAYADEVSGITTQEWWTGGWERGFLLAALLWRNPWLAPVALFPRLVAGRAAWQGGELIKFGTGMALSVALWLLMLMIG
jgi:hypothetical protein